MTKKSRQEFKYLENEKSFWGERESIFHDFQRAFSSQNCLRSESGPLKALSLSVFLAKKKSLGNYCLYAQLHTHVGTFLQTKQTKRKIKNCRLGASVTSCCRKISYMLNQAITLRKVNHLITLRKVNFKAIEYFQIKLFCRFLLILENVTNNMSSWSKIWPDKWHFRPDNVQSPAVISTSGKCDQIRRKLRIWSHLLRESLMENFIFCAVSSENVLAGFYLTGILITSK